MLIFGDFGQDLQQAIFDAAELLFYPVLVAAAVCLVWVLIELGWLVYELWHRIAKDYPKIDTSTLV